MEDGVADLAIIGENLLEKKEKNVEIVERLGFSKCRLSLTIPKDEAYSGLEYFQSKKIATSYPNSLKSFLDANNINAELHVITGSVEIAPNIGLADAVCDLVSSGSTLFKNGLKEVKIILKSEACLVKQPNLSAEKQAILGTLLFRLQSVLRAKNSKYVLMNVPNDKIQEISALLPVLKSPTILPLAHLMVTNRATDFNELLNEEGISVKKGWYELEFDKSIV